MCVKWPAIMVVATRTSNCTQFVSSFTASFSSRSESAQCSGNKHTIVTGILAVYLLSFLLLFLMFFGAGLIRM